jgi:hypothetical protein
MAERKGLIYTDLINELSTKKGGLAKRKKEAKKEKRVRIWKTLRVSHILTRQAITSVLSFIFKIKACIVHLRINRIQCKVITGFIHQNV